MSIDVDHDGVGAVVTINRPEVLNAVDGEHLSRLRDTLGMLAEDPAVRWVLLTGAGERAFSAGADIREVGRLDPLGARERAQLGQEVALLLEQMPKPTIAAVNGVALGGGCELVLACDLRLASSTASFGLPEVRIGVMPGWGGCLRLARATTLGFAKEVIFTGRRVPAEEAFERGLVNAVHGPDELIGRARALGSSIAEAGPLAVARAKAAANLSLQGDFAGTLEAEAELFASLFGSEDQKEGMTAFLEKRPPVFLGR